MYIVLFDLQFADAKYIKNGIIYKKSAFVVECKGEMGKNGTT